MSENPVHVVVDCTTGTVTSIPLTDDETAEARARSDAAEQQRTKDEAAEAELRTAVRNHSDPVVQALARRLGLA